MIDEEATFEIFGYHSADWAPKSRKKIVTVCDDCGTMRIVKKKHYRARCRSCAKKGRKHPNWKGGKIKQVCQVCGAVRYYKPHDVKRGRGGFCTRKCMGKWFSKNIRGEKTSNWKNGASFEPYCIKFNFPFKEYIRGKFGRICFLCPKTEKENGQRLSVHHVNGNKACGCDGDKTCQFVPLCKKCHSKVHSKKVDWEKKIMDKLRTKLNGWYI